MAAPLIGLKTTDMRDEKAPYYSKKNNGDSHEAWPEKQYEKKSRN